MQTTFGVISQAPYTEDLITRAFASAGTSVTKVCYGHTESDPMS